MPSNDDILKKYTPAQAIKQRAAYLKTNVKPVIAAIFKKYPAFKSAVLVLARDPDEMGVNAMIGFSIDENPDVDRWLEIRNDPLPFETQNGFSLFMEGKPGAQNAAVSFDANGRSDVENIIDESLDWDGSGEATALFYGFCKSGRGGAKSESEIFAPFAVFRRGSRGAIKTDIVGSLISPELDGIIPITQLEDPNSEVSRAHIDRLKSVHNQQARKAQLKSWKSSLTESPLGRATKDKLDDWRTPAEPPEPKEPAKPLSDLYILIAVISLLFLSGIIIAFLQFLGVDVDILQTTD